MVKESLFLRSICLNYWVLYRFVLFYLRLLDVEFILVFYLGIFNLCVSLGFGRNEWCRLSVEGIVCIIVFGFYVMSVDVIFRFCLEILLCYWF